MNFIKRRKRQLTNEEKLVNNLDISELKKLRLDTLFACYAAATENKLKEHTNLINEKTRQKK